MTGYLIVIGMLIVALLAVLLAFLLDHDISSPPPGEEEIPLAEPVPVENLTMHMSDGCEEETNNDGATSI
jgi:hypothetical protein